jgi:hypothetical protein
LSEHGEPAGVSIGDVKEGVATKKGYLIKFRINREVFWMKRLHKRQLEVESYHAQESDMSWLDEMEQQIFG